MQSELKKLIPILITPSLYLPMNILTNEEIKARHRTSVFRSVNPPFCNYVSFKQTYPSKESDGLSSLVYQPGSPSVIQFITSQLYYKIDWTLYNKSKQSDYSRDYMRLLVVDVPDQRGYEPWDINGNRIRFDKPFPGMKTKGSFTIPGEYLFIVIDNPWNNIDIQLKITGYHPKVDKWAIYQGDSTKFYIRDKCGRKMWAYTNSKASVGRISRTLNPRLKPLQDKVLRKYKQNPGLPCTVSPFNILPQVSEEAVILTVEINPTGEGRYVGSRDTNADCGNSYTNPIVTISCPTGPNTNNCQSTGHTGYSWINGNSDPSQIVIGNGTYKLSDIVVNGTTPTTREIVGNSPDINYAKGPTYKCEQEQDLSFVFYSVNRKNPILFVEDKSNPPPLVDDAGNSISMKTESTGMGEFPENYIHFTVNTNQKYFQFKTTDTNGTVYAFRLNSPIWEVRIAKPNDEYYIPRHGPKTLKATMTLTRMADK